MIIGEEKVFSVFYYRSIWGIRSIGRLVELTGLSRSTVQKILDFKHKLSREIYQKFMELYPKLYAEYKRNTLEQLHKRLEITEKQCGYSFNWWGHVYPKTHLI